MSSSFMGKVFSFVLRNFSNVNPETNDDQIKTVKLLELTNFKSTNVGYSIEKKTTPSNLKFEYAKKKNSTPNGNVVLYLHGGAYITRLIRQYRKSVKPFSKAANDAEVYMLEYDCIPATYPTQLNQALEFWDYLINDLHYKEENIIVGGDSAGGNLTLALLLKLRDMGKKMPKAAFCLSPWADMAGVGDSYVFNYSLDPLFGKKNGFLSPEKKAKFMNCDIFTWCMDADRFSPYVSPVFGDYHDFPPMFFTVGSHELLLSDTMTIYNNLLKNNVKAGLIVGDEMFHVYPFFRIIKEARIGWKGILDFIKEQYK